MPQQNWLRSDISFLFCNFKTDYEAEAFVYKIHNRKERSLLSQFRCGILPIRIETGRYTQVPPKLRLCLLCDGDHIENESHFFFECELYKDFIDFFFTQINYNYPNFSSLNQVQMLKLCVKSDVIRYSGLQKYSSPWWFSHWTPW